MREILLLVVALVLHECGHLLVAGILGVPLVSFDPVSVGAVMTFDFSKKSYITEALVHIGGCAFGILSALIVCLMCGGVANYFVGMSLTLAFVNLLPISGFDGGGAIRCILSKFFMPDTVWNVCRMLSFISVICLWTAVLWIELRTGGNLALIVFVLFVMIGQMK